MPFKYNADGTIAIDGEKKLPIFIHPNGTEAPFDADTTLGTITRLNGDTRVLSISVVPQRIANAWMGVGALGWMACLF